MARSFVSGAVSMTITLHRAPALRAASATPWAALPALTVQTPSAQLAAGSRRDGVIGAADLERPDRLQHLELQKNLRAARLDLPDRDEGSADGGVVDHAGRIADCVNGD